MLYFVVYGIAGLWFALMPNWTRRPAAPAKIGFMHVIAKISGLSSALLLPIHTWFNLSKIHSR